MRQLLDGLQHDNHHDRRAVRIGNDTTWAVQRIFSVDLRHDQRHIIVHAEGAGVVDHHSPIFRYRVCKLLTRSGTGRGKGDIHTFKIIVVLQQFHLIVLTLEIIKASGTTCRAEQHKVIHGEITLSENAQELLSHSAAGTDNSYSHNLFLSLFNNNGDQNVLQKYNFSNN